MSQYIHALKRVFSAGTYKIVGIVASIVWLLLFLIVSQITIISEVVSVGIAYREKLSLIGIVLFTSLTQMSGGSMLYLIVLSLLVGIQTTLFLFLVKQKAVVSGAFSRGMWGMILGMIGVGCSACGSVLFVTLLSLLIGTGNALIFFTQWGWAIGISGMVVLLYTMFYTLRAIEKPPVCR